MCLLLVRRERDRWNVVAPTGRGGPIGRDPHCAIGLAARHKALRIEAPRIVLRIAAAEAGANRKPRHPAAGLLYAEGVVACRKWQSGEACPGVEILDEAEQHFGREFVERLRRPHGDAEARGL